MLVIIMKFKIFYLVTKINSPETSLYFVTNKFKNHTVFQTMGTKL